MTNFIYLLLLLNLLINSSYSSPSSLLNPSSNRHRVDFSSLSTLKSFNVIKTFGAKNDGKTDATKAFLNAWNAACASMLPSQIYVPNGKYLLNPINFEGNCKSSILFRIDGTLLIANSAYYYSDYSWIVFHNVDGLHIKGGVLDAKGKNLWDCKASHQSCPNGAKSLSFDNSKNIIVDGLTSTNSQMFHITINACQNINMGGVIITADADSPNTDGIHIEKSSEITITDSQIMTGDDCISIGPNNQNIWIENVFCGPGHGISIGSLGRESDENIVVKNVTVKTVTFMGTNNGLRIKTFSTPVNGIVKDIYFSEATMVNVRNPIIIDQNYCPQGNCPNNKEGSDIQISNVVYKNIHGSSTSQQIVTFDCSPKKPCYGLTLQDIKLSYQSNTTTCECQNCYLKVLSNLQLSHCFGN
ncbi:hypothetical protein RND81_09G248100 [Saponaria officinalis]|uniref:Polygalacturonase n=1 Tax=Saponaria officinalis TaxID=3572 RepID=A0AAW1IQJ2_SAPOF